MISWSSLKNQSSMFSNSTKSVKKSALGKGQYENGITYLDFRWYMVKFA